MILFLFNEDYTENVYVVANSVEQAIKDFKTTRNVEQYEEVNKVFSVRRLDDCGLVINGQRESEY